MFEAVRGVVHWQFLGLELGIRYPQLEIIEQDNCGDTTYCKMEMLRAWLAGNTYIIPSWSTLKTALKNIGEHVLAVTTDSELITTFLCLYLHVFFLHVH